MAVALVLDKSGSMASDRKMEFAKRGALEAFEFLDGRDIATLVVYDHEAAVLARPKSAADRGYFSKIVSGVSPGGSTALYDGVRVGAEQLESFIKEGYTPRIVLLSDGLANIGPSSTRELAKLGRVLSGRDMTITTIGLGLDYNEDLMTALASESGGNSYFARTGDTLPDIFARDMQDATALSAKRVKITLTCQGETIPVRVIGRAGELGGKSLSVQIDNLYGAEKYALFEIEAPAGKDGASLTAATVKLEFVDAVTGKTFTREAPLKLSFTKNADLAAKNRRADIASQAEIARNAEIREEVVRLADEGRVEEASSLLKRRGKYLMEMAPAAAPESERKISEDAEEFESMAADMDSSGSMSNEQRKNAVNRAYAEKNQQTSAGSDDVKK
jgi:Ca-activated chloride channel family protein